MTFKPLSVCNVFTVVFINILGPFAIVLGSIALYQLLWDTYPSDVFVPLQFDRIQLPVIDLNMYSLDSKEDMLSSMNDALKHYGMLRIVNHGIPFDVIESLYNKSIMFFDNNNEYKQQYMIKELGGPGYEKFGDDMYESNNKSNSKPIDVVESIVVWFGQNNSGYNVNIPQELIYYIKRYNNYVHRLHISLHKILEEILGIKENTIINDLGDHYFSEFRLWNFNDLDTIKREYNVTFDDISNKIRMKGHYDASTIQILRADNTLGLQLYNDTNNKWYTIANDNRYNNSEALIIILGEVMEMYTNGHWKAPYHCVNILNKKRRHTISSYIAPNGNAKITVLKDCKICQTYHNWSNNKYKLPMTFNTFLHDHFVAFYDEYQTKAQWLTQS